MIILNIHVAESAYRSSISARTFFGASATSLRLGEVAAGLATGSVQVPLKLHFAQTFSAEKLSNSAELLTNVGRVCEALPFVQVARVDKNNSGDASQ